MYDSKHRPTDTQIYETRKDGSGYSSTKREWNLQTHGFHEETSNHRKYMRTQSSSNNRVPPNVSSSQQQRQNGEKKTAKDTKKPLRVSGDWSEFKSSTGKTYFYNCKTEVSQWEKPKGWPSDESNRTSTSSTDRIKKESTNLSHVSSTIRPRHKVDESSSSSSSHSKLPQKLTSENHSLHQNGNHHTNEQQLSNTLNHRLPSPSDDGSRMSFSSTSSKESAVNGSVLHSSLSEPAIPVSTPVSDLPPSTTINGSLNRPTTEPSQTTENELPTPTISKAEREQEIQKFYRADLIQHLTDWPSTQLEKQCLKLFDDYYGYTAKTSTTLTELKALKSNSRILEIKRNILTQRLVRCEKRWKEREEENNF